MVVSKIAKGGLAGTVVGWASNLRFPYLLLLVSGLFVLNVFIPDIVPFADEIIMGLVAALLANFKKKPKAEHDDA